MGENSLDVLVFAVLIQISLHLLIFLLFLRRARLLRSERGIFFYHLVSALLLSVIVVTAAVVWETDDSLAFAVGAIAAHGIYSLTFLEFWSLSQISYSREILLRAQQGSLVAPDAVPVELSRLGADKRSTRLNSIQALKLVVRKGDELILTTKGRIASRLLRSLHWLQNARNAG